ncbi:MAG: hypothetical protein OXG85_14100 [Chloroflexi bacterium]|nr:hypothetical protein [Chloroflexota bacterium]
MPDQLLVTSDSEAAGIGGGSVWRMLVGPLLTRHLLWRVLSRDARHPVAAQIRRQLSRAGHLPVLKLSLAFGSILVLAAFYIHSKIGHASIWLLPVWLMIFSTFYCAIWIARIVPCLSRQSMFGVLDEVSVIPPGPIFIYLTICKVVLNRDDAVVWLGLLRRILAGLVLLVLLMSLCIALALLSDSSISELAAVLLDLILVAAAIWLEHSQSSVLACLLAVEIAIRSSGNIDKTSVAVTSFVLIQGLCYAVALSAVFALDEPNFGLALFLFLLVRELLASALWRLMLQGANEDDARALTDMRRQTLEAKSVTSRVN